MNQQNQNPNQDFLKQRVNSFLARRNTDNQMDQSRNTQEEFQVTVSQMLKQDQLKIQVQEEQIYGQIKQKHKSPERTANYYQKENQEIQSNKQEDFQKKNFLSIPRGEFSYLTSASCLSIGDENIQQKQVPFQDNVKSNQEKFDQCQVYNKFNGRFGRNEDLIIFTEEVTNEMNKTNATNKSIEDRLIQEGLKMKFQKERRIKDYENYLKQQSNPKINQIQGSIQSDQDKNNEEKQFLNENVTERLFSYHQFYKEKKKLKKEIFEMENMPSFTPKINRGPKTTSNLQKENQKKSGFDQDLTFQPQIDKNSEKIAERLGKFEERLINRKSSTPEFQTFSYQPQINKKSQKLTTREGDVFSNLYEKNKEQQKKIEESKKIVEKSKKEQIDQECTFVPSLNKSSKYYKVNKEDINERINEKIKQLAQKNAEKEITGCTFQPQLQTNIQQIDLQKDKEIQQLQSKQNIEKSYDKFLQRLSEGRKIREEKLIQQDLRASFSSKNSKPQIFSKNAAPQLNESNEYKNVVQDLKSQLFNINLNNQNLFYPDLLKHCQRIITRKIRRSIST